MLMTSQMYLVGNIAYFKRVRCGLEIGHERPSSCDAFNVSFIVEFPQCPVGGHARHTCRVNKLILGWNAVAGLQLAVGDSRYD